jgi:hypothetical protein
LALLLYINGQLTDLDAGTVIAQTRQVNDLNSLDDRQASYTNKFSLPKTANNVRIMQFLTLPGNNSLVPYQKNECSLYSASGECFVYKGRAVITDGGDSYEAVIYDGIIDLYKAVENKTVGSLVLSEINHIKTTDTVKATWEFSNTLPYRYLLADYNGDTGNTADGEVNIDYLIPSVKVSYLWGKIFSTHNISYAGSVFNTFNFKNLYITYPKGISNTDADHLVFESSSYNFDNPVFIYPWSSFWLKYTEADTNELEVTNSPNHLKVTENGYYRLEVSGTLQITNPVTLFWAKNADSFALPNSVPNPATLLNIINSNQTFAVSQGIYLNAHESISLFFKKAVDGFRFNNGSTVSVKLTKVTANNLNFNDAFSDFSITDFLKEIVTRFALTLFTDKYTGMCTFLTPQELLQTEGIENWSSKFNKKISENYMYGSYAQRNWLRYNYNDKENTFYDYYIDIPNFNLPDNKDIIKSKLYAPEQTQTSFLSTNSNVYRFWDKEIKDNPADDEEAVSYKPLDKRYYLMRAQLGANSMNLYSKALATSTTAYFNYRENFSKLSWQDIVQDYYTPLSQILANAKVITAEFWLTEADVANFDFKKLYYIEQLSSYFIMNKINNYIPGKITKCELVGVAYNPPAPVVIPVIFVITGIERTGGFRVKINFTKAVPDYQCIIERSVDNVNWTSISGSYDNLSSPYTTSSLLPGTYYFRICNYDVTNNSVSIQTSNVVSITIP